jgi:hypothetical protein
MRSCGSTASPSLHNEVLAPRKSPDARDVHLGRPEGGVGQLAKDALEVSLRIGGRCERRAAHPDERLPVWPHLPIGASQGARDVSALECSGDVADHDPGVPGELYLGEPLARPHPRLRVLEDPSESGADLGTVASCCTELMNHGYAHDVVTVRPSEVLRSVGPVSISGSGPFLPKGRGTSGSRRRRPCPRARSRRGGG